MEVNTLSINPLNTISNRKSKDNSTPGFNKSVTITRFISKLIGVWPAWEEDKNFVDRYYYVFPAFMILGFCIIPQLKRVITHRTDFNDIVDVLSTAIFSDSIAIWKLLGCHYNEPGLKEIIITVAEDWKTATDKEKVIMWKYAKLSHIIVGSGLALTVGDAIGLCTHVPIVYYTQLQNAAENETIPKPFLLKSDFYFEFQTSPMHEIVYFLQTVGSWFATFCFTSCDGFFVFSILHFSGQFKNLQTEIEGLMETQRRKKCSFMEVLVPVIHRHRHLCRYTSLIEDNFNKIFLFQILATSILVCLQGYQFASVFAKSGAEKMAQLVFTACFAMSMIVSILMYCYVAEILRTQSEQLFHAVYNINWYNLPPHESKLLIIIMSKTQLPIEITMGKFVAFSLEYFCSVMKTSAGYLSVLLAMKNKL